MAAAPSSGEEFASDLPGSRSDVLGDGPETATGSNAADPSEGSVDGIWSCLSFARGEDLVTEERGGGPIALRVPFHDQFSQQPIADLEVRACSATDIACAVPIADWSAVGPGGVWVEFLPWGFSGYLEIRGANYLPTLLALDTPLRRDFDWGSVAVLLPEVVDSILAALNVQWDRETYGMVFTDNVDCTANAAAGVTVLIDQPGEPFALNNGVPVPGRDTTFADGVVGYVNVPAGVATLTATNAEGAVFDTAGVVLRPGWYTATPLRPVAYSAEELCLPDGARLGTLASRGVAVPCNSRQPFDATAPAGM